jgi:hypothetical protein
MARGRKAIQTDTTPGKVLVLALLANAPIAVAFIVAPLLAGGAAQARALAPYVLWGTPPLAAASLLVYIRAPEDRKMHRAARIGLLLDAVALALWLLVLIAPKR